MSRFAIRLLTLAMYATALVAVPMVTPAKAAADEQQANKEAQEDPPEPWDRQCQVTLDNPFPPMDEDPDRKAGGGGGY